jgi:hypothetical protein
VNCCIIVSYIKIIYTQFSIFDVWLKKHTVHTVHMYVPFVHRNNCTIIHFALLNELFTCRNEY